MIIGEKILMRKLLLLCISVFFLSINTANAYSFRQVGKDGLSNPVVASIYQDRDGLMWFGTNDGLNAYDGLLVRNFQTTEETTFLTGHAIGDIFETDNNVFWVLTNYGMNLVDYTKQTVESFDQFDLSVKIAQGPDNHIYIIKEDNHIAYYDAVRGTFQKIPVNDLAFDRIITTFIDQDNTLWVFMEDGNHRCFSITRTQDEVKLSPQSVFNHQEAILWSFYEDGAIYFVDGTLTLYEFNLIDKTKYYIQDIQSQVQRYGDVSAILKQDGDFYLGFTQGGLIRIKSMPEQKNQYQIDNLSFRPGVLKLYKDKFQDIVWIATNGQGVYMLFNEPSSLGGVLSSGLSHAIDSPITSLYIDDRQTLWIGSAGNGIVNIHDFNPERGTGGRSEFFLPYNSLLGSPIVNAFAPSSKELLWIGTENGINYYSYQERRVKNLQIVADGKPLKLVRAICEVNDSTLWVATGGEGLVKIHLVGSGTSPIVASAKRILAGDGSEAANMFTTVYKEDDSTVWFGTQGNGAYKVDSKSDRMENVILAKGENQALNDVFSILKNSNGYWFATGNGLVRMVGTDKVIFDDQNGFPHKTVHGLLEDNSGNLWMSTNRGIVKFNMEKLTSHLCKQAEDKAIVDFSDGVCYKESVASVLLFGGSNGFVTVNENDFVQQDYTPEITFNGLSVFGKRQNIYEYMVTKRNRSTIRLNYDQNVFGVSFVANDYIDGKEYIYFYKLNEHGNNWVESGSTNTAFFTYLAPGKYTLSTKYRNNVTGKESPVAQITVHILPQWYKTWWAYLLYMLVLAGLVYVARWAYLWYSNRCKALLVSDMLAQFSETETRSKLEFFAGMSNELYDPLALIQHSSGKILALPEVGEEVRKHVTLIQNNAEQLKCLVYDINELRTLTAKDRMHEIAYLPVSELADALAALFIEQAEARKVKYQIKIKNGLYWISDSYYLCKLIGNLLSNAFINVKEGGSVAIDLRTVDSKLQLTVSYTGECALIDQIDENDKFSYTKAIDMLEREGYTDSSTFDHRILTINYGIVHELYGTVHSENVDGKVVCTVNLPEYPSVTAEDVDEGNDTLPSILLPHKDSLCETVKVSHSTKKNNILLADNNVSMQCLLTDLLQSTYNIEVVADSEKVIEKLHSGKYDLLIVKSNMPVISGIELTKAIKADAAISHIPCVVLASSNQGEERGAVLETGADLYVPKPFDLEDLKKDIIGLMRYKKVQAHFSANENKAFELGDEHFETDEDRDFFEKIITIIEQHVKDTELSVEMISDEMGCTTQDLYSRLKGITKKTPNEIIRAYRINVAERLLVSTNLSVEEVISRVGFSSRSSFFKLFMQTHGMTPKNYREQQKKRLLKSIW